MSIVSDGQVSRWSEAQVSASMVLESRAKYQHVPLNQEGSQDLGCPMAAMQIRRFFKPLSMASKDMKNWNHEKSNCCESRCLQYLPCQMLGCLFPDIQIQILMKKSSVKEAWRQARTNHLCRSERN